ncbi:MAG: beta-ketoacyl-ACP synthase II [Candidatus Marinimicrobia bacterium]|nr:beta-ketoacyl-ACP synthase II [Candidatus Neomarinimicrobiota bacterium]
MKRRVVVTGIGVVSPIGNTIDEFWKNILECRSGVDILKKFDTEGLRVRIGAEVKDFYPENYIDPKDAKRMDIVCQFAMAAAKMAIDDSKLMEFNFDPAQVGVVTGSGIGGINSFEEQHTLISTKKAKFVSPFFIPMMIADIIPGHISMAYNFMGPNYSVASACATATHAIGISLRHILSGDADVVITGGAEASITPLALAGFTNMKALSARNDDPKTSSRPFDKDRDGFVMGEGAGILVLEELEHALRRGAPIYAELAGYGFSGDAHHLTAPHPEGTGASLAMKRALEVAGLRPEDIQYVNAHGTSTPLNDKYETKAYKTVFGDHIKKLNISSTKGVTGHLLGAAGAVEAIALSLAIQNNICPPTANYQTPDEECDLNVTPNKPVERVIKAGLSSNFGFGGHNAVIAMKKYE